MSVKNLILLECDSISAVLCNKDHGNIIQDSKKHTTIDMNWEKLIAAQKYFAKGIDEKCFYEQNDKHISNKECY